MQDYEYQHNSVDDEIVHEFLDNIICPYCGYEYEYEKSRDLIGNTTTAWLFYLGCKNCDKIFSVSWDYMLDDDGEETESIEFWTYHEDQKGFVEN